MSTSKTKDYLTALKEGDTKGIEEMYHNIYPKVLVYIKSNSGGESDALDIFHDSLEIMIYQVHKENSKIWDIEFEPYVFRICRNKWIDKLRGKKIFATEVSIEEELRLKIEEPKYEAAENEGLKQHYLKKALENTY